MSDMRPIPGFEGYAVTDDGRVYSHLSGKFLKATPSSNGYLAVYLRQDGKYHARYVHRLVMHAFAPPSSPDLVVNHKNFDRTDNRLDNLEWTTQKDNVAHACASFRHPNHKGRRIEADVIERFGKMRVKDIAAEFGLSVDAIRTVLKREFGAAEVARMAIKLRPPSRPRTTQPN
jgi:hypothetical protein